MRALETREVGFVSGGGIMDVVAIAQMVCDGAKALIDSDANKGQDGGQISNTPAA